MTSQNRIRLIFSRVVKRISKIIYPTIATMKKTTIMKMKIKRIKQKCMSKKIKATIGSKLIIYLDLSKKKSLKTIKKHKNLLKKVRLRDTVRWFKEINGVKAMGTIRS